MIVTRTVVSYDFLKPAKLTEAQFLASMKSLSIEPYINISGEFLKEYNIFALTFSIPFFPFAIISGYYVSALNYWRMLIEKRDFYTQLYSAINSSKTYFEYSRKYDQLVRRK